MSDSKYRPKHAHYRKNGPSWWRHVMTERRNRYKTHQLEHAIKRGEDADGVFWPVWNKPQIYWW